MLRALFIWLSIIPLAILNGGLRQEILTPLLGESLALLISGVVLCGIIFVIAFIFLKVSDWSYKKCWLLGLIWMLLTICFETIIGIFIGDSLQTIISNYDITAGNLWLVVVLFAGIVPVLVKRIKRKTVSNL